MQEALRASLVTFQAESGTSIGATTSGEVEGGGDDESEGPSTEWACEACTFVNSGGTLCSMCGTVRNDSSDSESGSSQSDDDTESREGVR